MKMLNSRVIKLGLMIVGLGVASAALAQSVRDQQIAERLQPVGSVCLAGEACAAGGSAPVAQAASAGFSAQGTYEQYCAMCHNTGMANAPRRDDADHWAARVEEVGLSAIVTNAINGINAMPPRGMCATC
ncbi:MAG: c-type cytochrome, partial [Gammaproteobacteria bacterium]|nr:c-type cytochrome [Gammaproteobacteria bacterium]